MIGFLKKNRLGRATFLPLTSIKNPQEFKNPEALKEKGVVGMADELVRTETRYKDVAKAMLGRIVVVDNVDNAVKIARKFDYGIRMVTIEGELLVPGGAISGGAFKNNSNLLGRRREMEDLEKKIKDLLSSVETIQKDIEETKQKRNTMRMELEALKADIQRKFIEQNTARLSVESAEERMEEAEAGSRSLMEELKEMEKQVLEIRQGKEEIQKELTGSEEMEKSVEAGISEFQKELEEKRLLETESSAKVSEWELKVEKCCRHRASTSRMWTVSTPKSKTLRESFPKLKTALPVTKKALRKRRSTLPKLKKPLKLPILPRTSPRRN